MLLQSLRTLCKAPGGPWSIWKYLEVLARATGVSGRVAYGFRPELHFANVLDYGILVYLLTCSIMNSICICKHG